LLTGSAAATIGAATAGTTAATAGTTDADLTPEARSATRSAAAPVAGPVDIN
jgi:hypothetical protein